MERNDLWLNVKGNYIFFNSLKPIPALPGRFPWPIPALPGQLSHESVLRNRLGFPLCS